MARLLASGLFVALIFGSFGSVEAQGAGTLSVTTVPVSGAIYVDNLLVGTRFWSGDLVAGSHVVSFGDVDGYIAPAQQTVTIIADQTYYVVGAYRRSLSLSEPAGRLPLDTDKSQIHQTISGRECRKVKGREKHFKDAQVKLPGLVAAEADIRLYHLVR